MSLATEKNQHQIKNNKKKKNNVPISGTICRSSTWTLLYKGDYRSIEQA